MNCEAHCWSEITNKFEQSCCNKATTNTWEEFNVCDEHIDFKMSDVEWANKFDEEPDYSQIERYNNILKGCGSETKFNKCIAPNYDFATNRLIWDCKNKAIADNLCRTHAHTRYDPQRMNHFQIMNALIVSETLHGDPDDIEYVINYRNDFLNDYMSEHIAIVEKVTIQEKEYDIVNGFTARLLCRAPNWLIRPGKFEYCCKNEVTGYNGEHPTCNYHSHFVAEDFKNVTYFEQIENHIVDNNFEKEDLDKIALILQWRDNFLLKYNPGRIPVNRYVRISGIRYTIIRTFTLVSPEDFDRVNEHKWHCDERGYVIGNINGENIKLHHFIIGKKKGMQTDHYNHEPLDNTRPNIENVSISQNVHNVEKKEGCSSFYKGVSFNKASNKWRVKHSKYSLGFFDDEKYAGQIYDCYVNLRIGSTAMYNHNKLGLPKLDWNGTLEEFVEFLESRKQKKTSGLPANIFYSKNGKRFKVIITIDKTPYSKTVDTLEDAIDKLQEFKDTAKTKRLSNKVITRNSDGVPVIKALVPNTIKSGNPIYLDMLVDEDKWYELSEHPWNLNPDGYPTASINNQTVRMCRYLMKAKEGESVSYRNRDKHDLRMQNLVIATRGQISHACNSSKEFHNIEETPLGKWRVRIEFERECHELGTYESLVDAINVYNIKDKELYGDFACPISIANLEL